MIYIQIRSVHLKGFTIFFFFNVLMSKRYCIHIIIFCEYETLHCEGQSLTLRKESSEPFSINSVMIITGLLLVTTPSRCMTLGWSNCPMMLASLRKSRLCFSVYPDFRVLMATNISLFPGSFRLPLHTSPNSPKEGHKQTLV